MSEIVLERRDDRQYIPSVWHYEKNKKPVRLVAGQPFRKVYEVKSGEKEVLAIIHPQSNQRNAKFWPKNRKKVENPADGPLLISGNQVKTVLRYLNAKKTVHVVRERGPVKQPESMEEYFSLERLDDDDAGTV